MPSLTTQKIAVVLLNLGGPLGLDDIQPFLFNFFMDENIISAPKPLRWLIAKYISKTRGKGAAHTAYGHLGFKSPLLENTKAQATALNAVLGDNHKVFVAMRYWHPHADETVQAVKDYKPDRILLLPLYPQFSTTTVRSSLQDWHRAAKAAGLQVPTREICCWFENEGFISAAAAQAKDALSHAPPGTRLLFSAHGLPEKIIKNGDPYQYQCEKTAAAIVQKIGDPHLDWQICYQSRVGPLKWIGPSTEDALETAAHDKKGVVIQAHAFVSEHVETLVEIDIEYRARAKALGIPYFGRAAAVATHPDFIAGLAHLVLKETVPLPCPATFPRCPCREKRIA